MCYNVKLKVGNTFREETDGKETGPSSRGRKQTGSSCRPGFRKQCSSLKREDVYIQAKHVSWNDIMSMTNIGLELYFVLFMMYM